MMDVYFPENAYYSAFQKCLDCDTEENRESKICNRLVFQQGQVGYREFSNNYTASGWFGRKVTTLLLLPITLIENVVQTIIHLATALIFGIFKSDRGRSSRAYLYCVVRDIQQLFGNFLLLLHDKAGLYHLQESQFHKKSYTYYLEHHRRCSIDFDWTPEEVNVAIEAKNISIVDAKDTLSDAHWKGLNLSQILSELDDYSLRALFPAYNKEGAKRFAMLSSDQVNEAIKANRFSTTYGWEDLLSDDQVRGLNLLDLNEETCQNLFRWYSDNGKRRFALLSSEKVNAALAANRLQGIFCWEQLLSDDQVRGLNLLDLAAETLKILFLHSPLHQHRFALLSSEKVNALIEADRLDASSNWGSLLSFAQIRGLNLWRFSPNVIENLFLRHGSLSERQRRFWQLPPETINRALLEGKMRITNLWANLFSEEQKAGLYRSGLTPEQIRILLDQPAPRRESPPRFFPFSFMLREDPKTKYCQALGLPQDATEETMRKTYRCLALTLHPDKVRQKPTENDADFQRRKAESEEKFKLIAAANTEYQEALGATA
jgi:hypothetical protein